MQARSSPKARCRFVAGDTEDALSARILAMEHRLYPLALKLVASGAAWLENGHVEVRKRRSQSVALASSLTPLPREKGGRLCGLKGLSFFPTVFAFKALINLIASIE